MYILKRKGWWCLLLLLQAGCGKREERRQEILALRELSELATAEYTVTKIVRANDDKTWYKIGERKILISCEASIKAGIDLSKLSDEAISVSGKKIKIQLPHAQLISLNLPPEKMTVEYETTTLFRDKFSTADRDALLAQAESQIRSSIDSLGILQTAETNASLFISNFLRKSGYETIEIRYDKKPVATPAQQ
jgi:Protein of unknown function (DUF4230)